VIAHASHDATPRPGLHGCARNVTGVQPARPVTLTAADVVASQRIARKRWAREELSRRGESKQDYIAAVLGVSRQYVARCLSESCRDEFSEAHLERLGLLDRRAA